MTSTSIETKCVKCGVVVAITSIRQTGHSFEMKPGFSLADLCPVIIKEKAAGKPTTEDECPHLAEAIDARVERFWNESVRHGKQA